MIELFPVAGFEAGKLSISLRPRGGDWLLEELRGLVRREWKILVTTLEPSELRELELDELAAACGDVGLEWIHFPISDRGLPSVAAMRSLTRRICGHLTRGDGVAVHCRQGIGRSSLVVAATLVERGEAADAAWLAAESARGRPVPDTNEQREWLSTFAARDR